jgi:hypothetical protein
MHLQFSRVEIKLDQRSSILLLELLRKVKIFANLTSVSIDTSVKFMELHHCVAAALVP